LLDALFSVQLDNGVRAEAKQSLQRRAVATDADHPRRSTPVRHLDGKLSNRARGSEHQDLLSRQQSGLLDQWDERRCT
jgi:hypothetical protein